MIVIMVSDCPPKVRGDLSKWLCEINTGVFVGTITARVREELWQRICENIKNGQATMVFNAPGEQKMDFRVHNTTWEPVDFDGIKLMRRPCPKARNSSLEVLENEKQSKIEKNLVANRMSKYRAQKHFQDGYVVLDIETTGVLPEKDNIIEIGALQIEGGIPTREFSVLIQCEQKIPDEVVKLTGIEDEKLKTVGIPLKDALMKLFSFAEDKIIIGHNVMFDYKFIRVACLKLGIDMKLNSLSRDTLALSRRKIKGVGDYQLTTLAQHFGYDISRAHRALSDCYLTYQLYQKLNEI